MTTEIEKTGEEIQDNFAETSADLMEFMGEKPITLEGEKTALDNLLEDKVDEPKKVEEPEKKIEEPEKKIEEPEKKVEEPAKKEEKAIDPKDALIEEMRQQILELSRGNNIDQVWPPKGGEAKADDKKVEDKKVEEKPKEPETKFNFEQLSTIKNFLTEDELDRVIDEPQLINVALERYNTQVVGAMISALPGIVRDAAREQVMVMQAVSGFYSQNEDLVPYADYVKVVMGSIESQNPTKTYKEIFDETAATCRKRLGLATPVAKEATRQEKSEDGPAFSASRKGGVTRPSDNKSDIFDPNAEDLLKAFG